MKIGTRNHIYDNELPRPDWFEQHEEEMHGDGGE